ncbi:MAG: hypothetical protein PSY12_14390 [bacterium]|nr:hypothetical protein [bacterium]
MIATAVPPAPITQAALVAMAGQVGRIERAAAFLANGLALGGCPDAAGRRRLGMSAKLIGNGLRELDLFLTDLIAEARRIDRLGALAGHDPGVRPDARIYSAAEAWRRAGPQLGLAPHERGQLRRMRALQNRHCFGQVRGRDTDVAMQQACADYARLAGDVLRALTARS